MAYLILGQSAPAATTDTVVYTVPEDKETVVSTLVVANNGTSSGTYRLHAVPAGGSVTQAGLLAPDTALPAKNADPLTWGITLAAGDSIHAYCSSGDFAINLFGVEQDV